MISLKEVENIQKDWGANLVKLGSLKGNFEACENEASQMIKRLYGYDNGIVLFKPTKAKESQFRLSLKELNHILSEVMRIFQRIVASRFNLGQMLGLRMLQLF